MGLLSVSAYAATHNASKQAAAKWKARGLLVFSGALVDVAQSDKKMRTAAMGRFKPRRLTSTKAAPVVKAVDAAVEDPVVAGAGEEVDEETLARFAEQLLNGRFASIAVANQVKENALALKHLVAARKAAGTVVDLDIAESVLFEASRGQRDAWMNWPSRIAPLLAADLNIEPDKVLEALTIHVQQHLQQLGEPRADFAAKREG